MCRHAWAYAPMQTERDDEFMISLRKYLAVAALTVTVCVAGAVIALCTIAKPVPQALHLPDGTDVFFLSDTRIEPAAAYPQPREIRVDGDAFLKVPPDSAPLIVRTRLLVLTISGGSALRVTAWSKETGEQAEVLHGHVQAHKSYPSSYSAPDILTDGEMTMINRTIDLMEKETTDRVQLQRWSDALMASARQNIAVPP